MGEITYQSRDATHEHVGWRLYAPLERMQGTAQALERAREIIAEVAGAAFSAVLAESLPHGTVAARPSLALLGLVDAAAFGTSTGTIAVAQLVRTALARFALQRLWHLLGWCQLPPSFLLLLLSVFKLIVVFRVIVIARRIGRRVIVGIDRRRREIVDIAEQRFSIQVQ